MLNKVKKERIANQFKKENKVKKERKANQLKTRKKG